MCPSQSHTATQTTESQKKNNRLNALAKIAGDTSQTSRLLILVVDSPENQTTDGNRIRFKRLSKQLAKASFSCTRILGLQAHELTGSKKIQLGWYRDPMKKAEKGTLDEEISHYLRHRQAWRVFAASEADWTIILDNDTAITSQFTQALQAINQLSAQWHMIRLCVSYSWLSWLSHSLSFGFNNAFFLRLSLFPKPGYRGYAIHRRAINKITILSQRFNRPLEDDVQRFKASGISVTDCFPSVIDKAPSPFQVQTDGADCDDLKRGVNNLASRGWRYCRLCLLLFPRQRRLFSALSKQSKAAKTDEKNHHFQFPG